MKSLVRITLPLVLLAAVAACGDDNADDGAADTVAAAETTTNTEVEPTVAPDATAPAADDTVSTTAPATAPVTPTTEAAAEGGTVTVEGAYGPIDIPADPQRIVGDLMTVDYLTALGYDTSKIIGVFDAGWFAENEDHYMADFFAEQQPMDPGSNYDVNLEALAAADPDLIMLPFDQIDRSPQLEQIQQIAPTLVVPTSEGEDPEGRYGGTASFQDWRSTIRSYGKLLGMEAEAESFITEAEAELAALSEEFGDLIAETSATEAKSTPDYMAINVLNQDRGVLGSILMSELGFTAPEGQAGLEPDEYGTIELSAENVNLLDGDILFLEVREGATTHSDSPLWETMSVVQNDNVEIVGNHWEYGGAVAARQVIADLRAALEDYASTT